MSQRQHSTYFRHYGELDNPSNGNGQEFEFDTNKPLLDSGVSRRAFMTVLSASMAMAAASCRRPDHKLVAAVTPTEYQIPGLPNYYTTVYQHKNAAFGLLVKAREGRPIKVDGNEKHSASLGSSSAFIQGTLLSLYDPDRIRRSRVNGGDSSTANAASTIAGAIKSAANNGKKTAIIIDEHCSPSFLALAQAITSTNSSIQFYTLPAIVSHSALANQAVFGLDAELVPDLSKVDFILSVDNDFLGTDKNAVYYTKGFSANRKPSKENPSMNKLVSIESGFSLTGANADARMAIQPNDYSAFLSSVLVEVASLKGKAVPSGIQANPNNDHKEIAKQLVAAKSPLIMVGDHLPARMIALGQIINQMLDVVGEGKPLSFSNKYFNSSDKIQHIANLTSDLKTGLIESVVYVEVNPEYYADANLKKLLSEKVSFAASLSCSSHETSEKLSKVNVPTSHYLESWGDAISFDGTYSIQQPIIAPLNENSLSAQDMLMLIVSFVNPATFAGTETYYDFIRKQNPQYSSTNAWETLLRDGVANTTVSSELGNPLGYSALPSEQISLKGIIASIKPSYSFYDGTNTNNSWLQELPDPITKNTWGNLVILNKKTADSLSIQLGEIVRVSNEKGSIELPAFIQPGVADNVITLTLGYGKTVGGNVHANVGENVYKLLSANSSLYTSVSIEKVGRKEKLATTQGHHAIERYDKPSPFDNDWQERTKDILGVQEGYVTFASLAAASNENHGHEAGEHSHHIADTLSIVPSYNYLGHRWAMAIDMSACTGCSACVIACQAENNIPSVGKKYVANSREMHWIRIDRYYREDEKGNVTTVFQPMLCQHCENAPCENVCPVAATTHSPEGLNEMTYNRCVGTRYCLNNCPYKVRRFNFLNWHKDKKTPLDLAFNPDVTVRMRGVMEKCTFCVQRLNEVKMHIKDLGRTRVHDGEAVTACQQACPANAIIFGDINDPKSKVAQASKIKRGNDTQEYKEKNGAFKVLSELNVRPSITYLVKVRNTNDVPKV